MPTHFYPRPGVSQPVSIFDSSRLASLRKGVTGDQANNAEAQREVAQQFEALFIQQLLKKARETASGNGLFDSDAVRMTQTIADEQMALNLSNPGFGLADALMAQMQQSQGVPSQNTINVDNTRLAHLRSGVGPEARIVDASSLTALIKKLTGSSLSLIHI